MKRILFVDDEVNVLDGLRNVLRKQRRVWEMVFAVGGDSALEELKRGTFDVVVSDMRMPGMDGAALLQIVKDRYPSTARLVLSGHAEREAVIRALPVAHQYLSKPCDVEQLSAVIDRTCALQAMLHDGAIRAMVSHLDGLPLAPRTYWDITRAAARPQTRLAEIGAIVERDPALVAKILQLVNSAYFGLAQEVTSITAAVQYLGLDLIKGLALAEHIFSVAAPTAYGLSIEELRMHSLVTAQVAQMIAADPERSEEVFTTAIVHDVGKLALASGRPEEFNAVVREARATGRSFCELEMEVFGATHASIGAYLLGVWGLPLAIVEAVAFHHEPQRVTSSDKKLVAAVHFADVLVENAQTGEPQERCLERLDLEFLASAGIEPDTARWQAVVRDKIQAEHADRRVHR